MTDKIQILFQDLGVKVEPALEVNEYKSFVSDFYKSMATELKEHEQNRMESEQQARSLFVG